MDSINHDVGKVLERDSNIEMEMMELFEDLSLEDIVVNRVGKFIGCKNMAVNGEENTFWHLESGAGLEDEEL
ncbi:hypothetical protein CsatB_013853 [Cannabis sativa]